jgi:hypothetical protein
MDRPEAAMVTLARWIHLAVALMNLIPDPHIAIAIATAQTG